MDVVPPSIGGTATRVAVQNLLRGFLALVGSVVITRSLGPGGRGVYSFVTNAVGLLVLIGTSGTPAALTRAKAMWGERPGRLYGASAVTGAVVGGIGSLAFLAAFLLLRHSLFGGVTAVQALLVAVVAPLVLLTGFWSTVGYLENRVVRVGWYSVAAAAALLALAGALATAHRATPTAVLVAWGVAGVVPLVLLSPHALRRAARPGWPLLRRLFSYSLQTNLASLALILVWRVDVLMVKGYRGFRELGWYAAAVSVGEILLQVSVAVRTTLVPSQGSPDDRDGLRATLALVSRSTVAVAGAGALVLAVLSGPVMTLLYGRSFTTAAPALALLAPGLVFIIAQGPLIDYLLVEGHVRLVTVAALAPLAVNVGMNALLLPGHTYLAASLASTVAYLLGFLMCVHAYCRTTSTRVRDLLVYRPGDAARIWRSRR